MNVSWRQVPNSLAPLLQKSQISPKIPNALAVRLLTVSLAATYPNKAQLNLTLGWAIILHMVQTIFCIIGADS